MNTYDSTGAVTYQELEKKIRSRYVKPDTDILLPIGNDIKRIMRYQHIGFGNEIPEALIVIHTDLQDYWFAAKISDEYKTFCKNHGIAGVDAKISITDDTILLMPAAIECNGYTFATVWQENSEKGIECFCISSDAYLRFSPHPCFLNKLYALVDAIKVRLGPTEYHLLESFRVSE